jgi:putative transposase
VASERDRPDVARRGEQWTKRQDQIAPERLVFIDETWTKTNMEPLRGWAPLGQRLVAKVPHGHWKTMTFIAALRCNRIEAPWILDGPINAEAFKIAVVKT